MIRVLIVDDHIVVRLGLRTLIQSQSDMEVAGDAGSGQDALAAAEKLLPDLIVMDLRMPDGGGIEAVKRIRASIPAARVLFLSSFCSEEEVYQAIQAGARGYIRKDAASDDLLEAIRRVHAGGTWIPPEIAALYSGRLQRQELTHRENEILRCVFRGLTNKEIAYELGVAENTVKNHINNLMSKLEAKDRTHATHLALVRGLLSVE